MDPHARRPRAPRPSRGVQIRTITMAQKTNTTFRQATAQARVRPISSHGPHGPGLTFRRLSFFLNAQPPRPWPWPPWGFFFCGGYGEQTYLFCGRPTHGGQPCYAAQTPPPRPECGPWCLRWSGFVGPAPEAQACSGCPYTSGSLGTALPPNLTGASWVRGLR